MPWIIDKDLIGDPTRPEGTNSNAKGLAGPSGYKGDGSELQHKFRMYDDDGELYYEGRSHDSSSFGPLDNFGMPNAGATEIRYLEDGKWQTL